LDWKTFVFGDELKGLDGGGAVRKVGVVVRSACGVERYCSHWSSDAADFEIP
jgi:hypothetical protein